MSAEGAYELFKKGSELLEAGDFMAASIPLERARSLEPDKSSIREALGRAYFRSSRFEEAAEEFAAVVVNDISRPEIGFDAPDNEVTIVTAEGERHVPLGSKEAVAAAILDAVEGLRTRAAGPKQPAGPAAQGE